MSQIGGSGSGSSSVGDPVSVGHGGTGLTTIASGKILYSSALDTIAALGLGTHLSISGGNLVTDATSIGTASKLVTRDASGDAAFHALSVSTNLIADATVQGLTLKTAGAANQILMLDRDQSGHECDIILNTSVLSIFLSENGSTWTFDDINSGLFTTPNLRVNGVTTFVSGTITASSAPYIDGSQTWNNAAVVFTAIKSNITNTASAAGSLLMDLQVGGSSKFAVGKGGDATISIPGIGTTGTDGLVLVNSTAAAAGAQQMSPRVHWTAQGWKTNATAASQTIDCVASLLPVQAAANPTAQLQFLTQINGGGYNVTFAIQHTGARAALIPATGVQTDLGLSNQQFTWLYAGGIAREGTGDVFSIANCNFTFGEGVPISFGTSTGTKIGTATGQKIGFWNATPVVQQVLATGAAHTVDDVITLLQTLGLCKQS